MTAIFMTCLSSELLRNMAHTTLCRRGMKPLADRPGAWSNAGATGSSAIGRSPPGSTNAIVCCDTTRNEHEVTEATSINDIARDLTIWLAARDFLERPTGQVTDSSNTA
ncbi:hypothetical protein [Streptomyces sp. NPDC058695]|uniref:hypothetical protein n=1 Tax=Streptomyces sp. NPDC058695 TaxID=3346604 RepID=UPI0036583AA9